MENYNENADLAAEIYRSALMGASSVETLMKKTDGEKIQQELINEKREYDKFRKKAEDVLQKHSITPKPLSKTLEKMSDIGIKMNTAVDSTPSHIADILIQGNNMGIISVTKLQNKHKNANEQLLELAHELNDMQQNNIERLKSFL